MIISMQKIKDDSSLKCYPPMMNMSIQKMQYINWLLQEILMIKYPAIWLDKRPTWPHPTKGDSFTCYLTLRTNSMQKKNNNNWDINWISPEILLIKEFCNLTGREVRLATFEKSGSFNCYLPLKIISVQKF